MTPRPRRRVLMFAALSSGACAKQVPVPSTAPRPEPVAPLVTHAAFEAAAPIISPCAEVGPFSCDLPSRAADDLCAQLAKCLTQRDPARPEIRVSGCGELTDFEAAPAESGVARVAVVNLDGVIDGVNGQGSYLVAERGDAFCLVDQALRWESLAEGYLDTDSRLAWHHDGGRTLLSVRTQSMRFDESEDEGADVRSAHCRDAEYALDGGRFVTVREHAVDEPCSDED